MIISIILSVSALPKLVLNTIPFNGFNFNDIIILPLSYFLLSKCIAKHKKILIKAETINFVPQVTAWLLQISFFYALFFDAITKENYQINTISHTCHIIHISLLLFIFFVLLLYMILILKLSNSNEIKNTPFFSIYETLFFIAIYSFSFIWYITGLLTNTFKADFIMICTQLVLEIIHIFTIVIIKRNNSFKKNFFTINIVILISVSLLYYIIVFFSHISFIAENLYIFLCIIIIAFLLSICVFLWRSTDKK